jgi:hypothetical protein
MAVLGFLPRALGTDAQHHDGRRSFARRQPGRQRPNQVLDNPYGDKSWNNFLNPAAFAQPAFGTFGNAVRNGYYGKGSRSWTCQVVRAFRFGDNGFEARIESFNLFNWLRPGGLGNNGPVLNLTNANFGRYLQADDPRIMHLP